MKDKKDICFYWHITRPELRLLTVSQVIKANLGTKTFVMSMENCMYEYSMNNIVLLKLRKN